jgi:rhomboid protease GluP
MAACVRCGKDIDPAPGRGTGLLCVACAARQPRVSVTAALIATNVLVFILMAARGVSMWEPTAEQLVRWGAGFGPYSLGAQPWRLFTAMFIHIGILHIAFNMLCLWSLGPIAELIFGWRKYLSIYLLSGLAGSVASAGLHPMIVAAGASGAIFGVAGAMVAVVYLRNLPALVSARSRLGKLGIVGFVMYNLVWGAAHTGIDNAAHVGGLAVGFLIALAIPVAGSQEGHAAVRRSMIVLVTGLVFITGAYLGARRLSAAHFESRTVQAQKRPEDVVRETQAALRGDPDDTTSLAALGSAFYELKRWPQAVDAFTRYTRTDSTNAAMWANLGDAYLNWGHAADAVHPLARATALRPDDPSFQYLLGRAYLESQQYALAVGAFDAALKLAPGFQLALEKRQQAARLLAETRSQ